MNQTLIGCYAKKHDLFPIDYLQELRSQILSSTYLASNHLSENFANTKGFSLVFKRSGIDRVKQRFPYLITYLDRVLKPSCNAFYLNPLIIEAGTQIDAHIDCSISSYGMEYAFPNLVSIFYLQVSPDLEGGDLILHTNENRKKIIKPQTNTLIHFLGNLTHSVNRVKSSQPRISLICEQYNLSETRLDRIPELEIESLKQSQSQRLTKY
jgi:Rps23 Pro-64 3,4-dihydroxylase Tpa1-like proline 4-hydroxylase